MAVGFRLTFADATQEQYDATHKQMDIEHDPPPGLIFHCAGPVEGGWGIVDCWESRETFDVFVAERLQPAVAELGSQAPPHEPDVEEFTVHSLTRPWLLRWGTFAFSPSSPALVRAREVVSRLSSSRGDPPAEADAAPAVGANGTAATDGGSGQS